MPIPTKEELDHFHGVGDFDADQMETCDVKSPSHYTVGGYEAIDILRAKLTPEEYRGYLKGNILKYMMRANYKGHHDQDCSKAHWYADELERTLKSREVQHGTEADWEGDVPF